MLLGDKVLACLECVSLGSTDQKKTKNPAGRGMFIFYPRPWEVKAGELL